MGKGIGLSGMTWTSMKKHTAVIPLYALCAAGAGLAGFYLWRLAAKSPEVTWNRKTNPEPWNAYENKQYKFLSSGRDYTEASPAPKYK
ncbi:unnamed protein product [Allacma fusca]|uniref:NADH dehydrogenase [ubiquinone] 1 alpha subcomplex subunit 4 n=1 Tax=Allacma fusca TaxID=39272 RepID=A0A8J2LTS3_9HEXA|nr:unnamed protein product [Allacma fusca]